MPNIFQINSDLQKLLDGLVDIETGEILPAVEAQINALETVKTQKLVGCRNYYQHLAGQIDAAEMETARIQNHVKHMQNVQQAIERILIANVPAGEKVKDDTGRTVIGWRKCPDSVEIVDADKAMAYCKEHLKEAIKQPEPYLLKTPIKEAIENSGVQIDGVKINKGKQNIQIK